MAHDGVLMEMKVGDVSLLFFLSHSSEHTILIMEHFFPVKYSESTRHGVLDYPNSILY